MCLKLIYIYYVHFLRIVEARDALNESVFWLIKTKTQAMYVVYL